MKKIVFHFHEKFWPHNAGSTHRLSLLIQYSKHKHIVFCRKYYKKNVYHYKNAIIITYKNLISLFFLTIYAYYRYKSNYNIIFHSHNYRPSIASFIPFNVPRVLELHSVYLPSSFFKKFLSHVVYNFHKNVILLSNSSIKYLPKSNKNFEIIYNSCEFTKNNYKIIDLKIINPILYKKLQELIYNYTKIYCYIGSLDSFQGIKNILLFSKYIHNTEPQSKILIVGGKTSESIKFKEYNNITHFPSTCKDYVPYFYSISHFSLQLRDNTIMNNSAISLKVIESFTLGVPVITTSLESIKELSSLGFSSLLHIIDLSNFKISKSVPGGNLTNNTSLFNPQLNSSKLDAIYERI